MPIRIRDVEVSLSEDDYAALEALKATGVHGASDGEVLRDVLFSWWGETFLGLPDMRG